MTPRADMTAGEVIARLNLKPLNVEGGWFAETYRAAESVSAGALPARYRAARCMGTCIYYLLTSGTMSRLHRVRSDEIFHFLLGDPVTMLMLFPDGQSQTLTLGPDLAAGQRVQAIVPHGVWQGAVLGDAGRWALLGVTVAPGFEYADFEPGTPALAEEYPDQRESILRLCGGGQ